MYQQIENTRRQTLQVNR